MSHDKDEDFILCSPTWKCRYLNGNSLVISPTLYRRTSEAKFEEDRNSPSFPTVLDIPRFTKTTQHVEDKFKTKSFGPSKIKYLTVNKEVVNAFESGSKVKRLICITDNKPSSRSKLDRSPNASEEKVNISIGQCERQENVTKTQASVLCVIHSNKNINSEDVGLRDDNDIIENYKNALAILRGQTAQKSCLNPSESLEKSSFHGHIQTCISQLSNQSPVRPTKLISCDDNSSFLKSAGGKLKGLERQRFQTGHPQGSSPTNPVITMSKVNKTHGVKFVWSQNTQEISKVGTYDDKTPLIRIFPLSSGKENAVETQDVWGFPAFHPYTAKTQHGSSSCSRNQSRSGKRNQSAPRHVTSSQSQLRHISDASKDSVPSGSQVTLGLMLNAIKNGIKQDQVRVMLGQTNRFTEA
ncbi:uncharacterized protein LOC134957733 isoform X2 [Pseudophryne corroboree]